MAEKVILLDLRASPFAMRVRIALAEKGIEFESREEDLSNKSPLLLKLNPVYKQVPVLIHKGKPICQSLLIVQYIDEVWNHKSPLLPSNPHERAHARFWADYVEKNIFEVVRRMVWTSKSNSETLEAAAKELTEGFKVLEGELGDKPYFGGETFGFVDVALVPLYSFTYTCETLGNFNMEIECPKLMSWAKRCIQKKSVSKSLQDSDKVYEFFVELKKKMGVE